MKGGGALQRRSLAQRLSEAEATVAALLSGQIDAVVDSESKTPVLLSKAQEALRESEERYRRIVETTNEGILTVNTESGVTFVNRRLAELFGYSADEMLGMSLLQLLPDTVDAREAHRLRDERSRLGISDEVEVGLVRRDGSELWVLLKTSPIRDADGHYAGTLAMVTDRTHGKQAESSLRYERGRAQRYLDTATVILLVLDVDGRIELVNRYACSVLGWTAEELIGRDWIEMCLPRQARGALRDKFHDLVGGDISVVENSVRTRSGEERLIEWRNTVVRDEAGQVIGTLSSGTDITDRHQAEVALRTAEERMRFALQNADVGIWDMDYDTGVVQWSGILESQYGLQPGAFGGTLEAFIECIHPDDREAMFKTMEIAATSGTEFSTLNRAIWPDGTVRWLSGTGRIILGEHGKPVRGVGISQDVTERRTLEAQYQQAQKMEAVGRLASGVAHDFNNMLTVILGSAELVTADVRMASEHGADLGEIIKAAQRATGLTKQLLAFSRQQVLHTAPVDLNALITDMTGMLCRLIGEHIEVTLALAPNLPPALADRGQLEQVVMNLVVNARDAMPDGGRVTIETSDRELENSPFHEEAVIPGNYVMVAITDTGTGMTAETRRRLFEPFFTTKESGKGTGLGLSTTYGIVKQSKGHIWVYSEPGLGTTFKVYLPHANRDALSQAVAPVVTTPAKSGSETVLLVEDEPSVRRLAKRVLDNAGYRVLEAANGDDAEKVFALHEDAIDLLVTDMVMPRCTGPELFRRLHARAPALRVLYMSGYTEQSAAHDAEIDSGFPFVQKPFTATEFVRRVRDMLDRQGAIDTM